VEAVHSSAELYVKEVSDLVDLSILCNASQTSLTLVRSTFEIFIPEKDREVRYEADDQRFFI
jgi:hypothetical protein